MATIIEEFLIRFGIDAKGVQSGGKEVDAAVDKTKANIRKSGKEIQDSTKATTEGFSGLRGQVLSLFALFTGGRGIKDFTTYINTMNAATGRLALTTGMAVDSISAWAGLAPTVGGSSREMAADLAALDRTLINIGLIPGSADKILPAMNWLGIRPFGPDNRPIHANEFLDQANLGVQGKNPREVSSVLAQAGLSPSMIALVLKKREDFLADQKRAQSFANTPADAAAAKRSVEWTGWLTTAYERLGTVLATKIEPGMTAFKKTLVDIASWLNVHKNTFENIVIGAGPAAVAVFGFWAGLPALIVSAGVAMGKFYRDWESWNKTGISDFANLWTLIKNTKDWLSGKTEPNAARAGQLRLDELMREQQAAVIALAKAQAKLAWDDIAHPMTPDEKKRRQDEINDLKRKVEEAHLAVQIQRAANATPPPVLGADFDARMRAHESGKMEFNKLGSGAYGPYQFMQGTWNDVRKANPGLNLPSDMTTATREQHEVAYQALKEMNRKALLDKGIEPTAANMLLAHQLGVAGAISVLRANPNTPMSQLVSPEAYRLNPNMQGRTAADFIREREKYMAGVGTVPPATTTPIGAPAAAASAAITNNSSQASQTVQVNVDNINLVTPQGADAKSHAGMLLDSLQRQASAAAWNMGPI